MTKTKNSLPDRLLIAFLLAASLLVTGCSTVPVQVGDTLEEPVFSAERIVREDTDYVETFPDPWEGFNRTMYRFNYRFDKYVFLPAVGAYQAVMPDFAEKGVHNFFTNFRQISTLINSILQFEGAKALETTSRLLVYTTIGILGLFDWASPMGIPYHQEDFGQTLGVWGVGSGPYLVLPILGPSSVRDGTGLLVDAYVRNEIRNEIVDLETWQEWTWTIVDAIDTRANVAFRYYETGSPFEYEWVRMLYSTKRQLDIEK
jgi:phospholipid-binding lipoprotein MlaA